MTRSSRKKGLSWELIGIVAVLAVFVVAALYAVLGGGTEPGELEEPAIALVPEDSTLETGLTEDERPYVGAADAPVTVYEFADFQCPHCRNFSDSGLAEIKRDYVETGRARVVWVNFPIMGDESTQAAKAGYCAAQQGEFWAMHDWLFANQPFTPNQGVYTSANLSEMANRIGIDATAFEACLSSSEAADNVAEGQQFGRENNVSQTPTFLIGDTLVEGGDTPKVREAIEAAGG